VLVGVVLALALVLAVAWSLRDARRRPERWTQRGERWWRAAAWGAAFVVAVVAGAALAGAGWEELGAIALVGWGVVRLIAALFANDAFIVWLRRRSGRD
jgi:sterol desaturase/sphingolipid hydroxylase (fatty acid hydroxylase superfamily)